MNARARQLGTCFVVWAAVAFVGCAIGVILTRVIGPATMRDLDGPVRTFFTAHQQPGFRQVMTDVTLAGTDRVVCLVAVVAGILLRRRGTWLPLVLMLAAYLGAALISASDKIIVARGRATGHGITNMLDHAFPSGHATQAAAVYAMLAILAATRTRRSIQIVVGLLAGSVVAAVALSRVYLGAHWFTDAAAGVMLGTLWAVALAVVAGIGRRRLHGLATLRTTDDCTYDIAV